MKVRHVEVHVTARRRLRAKGQVLYSQHDSLRVLNSGGTAQSAISMALVNYSDSDSDSDSAALSPKQKNDGNQRGPATKKRKISSTPSEKSTLPPLPQSFRDLYSSTVRTSTVDDPALHGGRKRVIPHVHGNWPAHVYLECKSKLPITVASLFNFPWLQIAIPFRRVVLSLRLGRAKR